MTNVGAVSRELQTILSEDVDHLLDSMLGLMEQDINDGWRVFYARELWFVKHLPPPLINELGRSCMTERLRESIWRRPGQEHSAYQSSLLQECRAQPQSRQGYRNYLEPGTLSLEGWSSAPAWDQVADMVTVQEMESKHRHMLFEVRANQENWYVEACHRGTLTPPLLGVANDELQPVRNPALRLRDDVQYWRAVHRVVWSVVMNADDYPALVKPECTLELMRHIAPDFPYAADISTTKRLIFVQQGSGDFSWALMIDKTSGSPDFRYPPQLILIDSGTKKKLKDEQIIFQNVIGKQFPSFAKGPRGLETELLFHVPRCRKLIDIYQPYIEQVRRI